MKEHLEIAIEAALAAGREIMKYYFSDNIELESKGDDSPLTIADRRANEIINRHLIPSGIPIISEENEQVSFQERRKWNTCWIVDPLDGTKEFINGNGEFTVNIALISNGNPSLGVIYAPALRTLYFAIVEDQKAFKHDLKEEDMDTERIFVKAREIFPSKIENDLSIVVSRSHMNKETLSFIEDLKKENSEVKLVERGSSLKFCLIAEGMANIYPRFGPTMEWDTAAGQAICEAVGVSSKFYTSGSKITYNRENLRNENFYVSYEG